MAAGVAMLSGRVGAQLPSLDVRNWVGHFLALEFRDFQFALTTHGEGKIIPFGRTGKPVGRSIQPSVSFFIEETLPDGRVVARKIQPESLESASEAATALEAVTLLGEATGGARFEVYLEADRDVISIGGRVTDPGTLNPEDLRFTVRVSFPSAYRSYSKAKQEERTFQRRVKGDRLVLQWADGKRARHGTAEPVRLAEGALDGPGIAEMKLSVDAYQERVFVLAATEGSAIKLWNRGERPLHAGFSANWQPDPAADPEGKARLVFTVK